MLGTVILSLLISAVAFQGRAPLDRALHTVGLAWSVQTILTVLFTPGEIDSEGMANIAISAALAVAVGAAFWCYFARRVAGRANADDHKV